MNYIGDKDFWNKRHGEKDLTLREPDILLKKECSIFKEGGRILDIACGDGKNAIYLAKKGFDVTAVDFSDEAINRVEKYADFEQAKLTTKRLDLNELRAEDFESFDGIVINHYRLPPKLYKEVASLLKDGCYLWINTHRGLSEENPLIREEDVFNPKDLEGSGLKVLDSFEYEEQKRCYGRYLVTKEVNDD